jgi:parallel beta-helix repeat protein
MDLINNFGNPTGAGLVGTTSFYTSTGNKYQFAGSDVQAQIEEAGDFLDEGASFREKAFNAFVAEGMSVTQNGGTADIASGFVAANGRMLKYNGCTGCISIPDGVTSYVLAKITNGVVIIDVETSVPTRAENPIVILHKITRAGAVWTTSVDLRRFGMFVNDKNYISVGNTPSSGRDGYGCDFTSLKSAVEFAKTVNSGNDLIPPLKIILASDISITSAAEMEIQLNVDGIQIDGCGRKVTTNIDAALFDVEADNVTIRDITLESNLAVSGSNQCLAHIGNSTNISGVTITNCKVLRAGGTASAYFLRLGNAGATTTVSNSVISENIAEVEKGGIEYVSINKYATVLRDSVILGNNIYQSTFSSTSYAGIKASIHCTLGDNIVKGGFDTGILLALPSQCRVDGNLIIGYSSAVIYMNNGIAIWNSAAGQDNGCVISDNTIKGIADYGIDCRAGAGSGAFISVYGNFIDNYYSVGSPPTSMIGIRGRGAETWVVGNKITAPGDYGIENCSHAIGNQIYGHSGVAGSTAAIAVSTSVVGVIADNTIRNVAGTGIYVANNSGMAITGNVLLGNSNSSTGIDYIGNECVVVGNTVMDYVSGGIQSVTGTEITVANNKVIDCQGQGVSLDDCTGAIVVGNWLESPVGTGSSGISGVGSYSVIANNYIANYGSGGYWAISLYSAANIDVAITGNVIKNLHINTQGVLYTPGGWSRVSVVGNVLDNCPYTGFSFSGADQVLCANNIISGDSTSTNGITGFGDGSVIVGNMIETYCSNNTDTAIHSNSGADDVIVANNHIVDCNGVGIDMNSGENLVISNNYMRGASGSRDGIREVNQYSIISGNLILEYGGDTGSYSGIITDGGSGKMSITDNLIYLPRANMDYGIYLNTDFYVVAGNIIGDQWNPVAKSPIDMNGSSGSIIANNFMGTSQTMVAGDHGIKEVGGRTIVVGNLIMQANDSGIEITGDRVLCANNIIDSPYYDGIFVSGPECLIVGNYINDPGDNGIETDSGGLESIINSNHIRDAGIGISVVSARMSICGNFIDVSTLAAIVIGSGGDDSQICFNYMYDTGNGITMGSPRCLANGNFVKNSTGDGIQATSSSQCSIIGNHIVDATVDGVCVSSSNQVLVSSNYIYSAGDNAIEVDSSSDTSVVGNYIYDPTTNGVELSGTGPIVNNNWIRNPGGRGVLAQASATYATIQNNYIWSPGNEGIRGESGANELFITGNMIRETADSGIYLDENIFSSIIGNYIYNPGDSVSDSGISLNNASGHTNVSCNWIFSPSGKGIYVGETSAGCTITGNWIRDAVDSGIYFSISASECVIVGNFLTRCGGDGSAQIDLISVDDWVCVGNNINSPTNSSSDGIAMNSSDGGLCVGNRAVGGGSATGIDYTSATDYVIEGNMSRGGANPGGFAGLPLLGDDNGYKV